MCTPHFADDVTVCASVWWWKYSAWSSHMLAANGPLRSPQTFLDLFQSCIDWKKSERSAIYKTSNYKWLQVNFRSSSEETAHNNLVEEKMWFFRARVGLSADSGSKCAKRPMGQPGNIVVACVVCSICMLARLWYPCNLERLVQARQGTTVWRGTLVRWRANSDYWLEHRFFPFLGHSGAVSK